eukprot:CAMPEP_0176349570 /NCGR_PEP_ID=MMETSP0126-20121128/8761_1 /TAXON_ID=141414 ORGANISM="Strombidinopsis acuminatum, Strain SPMC142" /NCGR_SAMPLE_ID=MMETSP0126 /ASSEMBLY_ACC=CAM_ASM_000229 /LENGTH=103 /DNA_ID=CAMNT_0017699021 /DNA_START=138 /DNA_END=449 /DNA_ORIENTATION=+
MIQTPKRMFQTFGGKYRSGFDRMLEDKLSWSKLGGNWFILFGLGNLACYGLSLYMYPQNYKQYFAYRGGKSAFAPLRAQMGSDSLANAGWTVPSMLACGYYLN